MSGLVFVRDAQARPLMPTSAAYARTLIGAGKAHLQPHPALHIVQLTDVVPTPILRPVLIGFTLQPKMAGLVVVVDQARTDPSTFSIIIDLHTHSLDPIQQRSQRTRLRPAAPGTHVSLLFSRLGAQVQKLAAVMAALRAVLPISHIITLPPDSRSAVSILLYRRIRRLLGVQIETWGEQVPLLDIETMSDIRLSPLVKETLIERVISPGKQTAHVVARVHDEVQDIGSLGQQQARLRASRRMDRGVASNSSGANINQLGTVRHNRRVLTGLLKTARTGKQVLLDVPVGIEPTGVRWQPVVLPVQTPLYVWPTVAVTFIPLQRKVPLLE